MRPKLDDRDRDRLGVAHHALDDGATAYTLAGDPSGPRVVLVHGTTTPSFGWAPVADALVDAGFAVLTYDLFGRGLSDRPRCRYDLALYVRQLDQLLRAVGWTEDVRVAGWSLGGVIGAAWAGEHPDIAHRRIVLMAPAGFGVRIPWIGRLVRIPVLGDAIYAIGGRRGLAVGWRSAFVDPDRWPEFGRRFGEQLAWEGVERAVLSTLRHVDLHDQEGVWRRLAAGGRRTLLLWGTADAVCPVEGVERTGELLDDLRTLRVQGAGHALHWERREEVAEAVVGFFTEEAPSGEGGDLAGGGP